jgi:hypothetical protein
MHIYYILRGKRAAVALEVGILKKLAMQLHDLVQLPNGPLHGHDLFGRAAERGFQVRGSFLFFLGRYRCLTGGRITPRVFGSPRTTATAYQKLSAPAPAALYRA